MTPNLDDEPKNKRVMSRESLIDNHNDRHISFEKDQLTASAAVDDRLKNSAGGILGQVNYSKYQTVQSNHVL